MKTVKYKFILLALTVLVAVSACNQESQLQRLERETRDFTKNNCPSPVSQVQMLDSIVFYDNGTNDYIYYYSVTPEYSEYYLDLAKDTAEISALKNKILYGIKNALDMKKIMEMQLNIIHVYTNAETKEIIQTFRFTPQDYNGTVPQPKTPLQRLEDDARRFTKTNCPIDFENGQILDSLVFHDDGVGNYTYYYSVKLDSLQSKDFFIDEDSKRTLRQTLVDGIRQADELFEVKNEGLNICYIYRDSKTHKTLLSFKITEKDYNK